MKRLILILSALPVLTLPALAGQWSRTASTAAGSFALTNRLSNAQYEPVAALVAFAAPATGTVRVDRISQGKVFPLSAQTFTNVATLVWTPDFPCGFALGDVLRVTTPAVSGSVQLIVKDTP